MGNRKRKKLPIGISDFKEIIENNYYYFDKTKFIENILEDGSKVKLFTRPRRFGKTLNMSMLKYFFDIKNKGENRKLFENLEIDSYIKGNYEKCIAFFKAFYGKVLKDNNYLEIGILTGILRVAKENVFSGLNNLEVHTILDDEFTEYFGIMENEVEKSLEDFDLKYELNDVQKWYNGYLFGEKKVYNPWSIINFLKNRKLKPYWVNTSENGFIKLYLQKMKKEIFDDFSKLLNKEEIFEIINDSMTFGNLEANFEKNIWNLFFHSGYLTLAREYNENNEETYLKIPNKEILKMFSNMFIEVYFGNSNNFSKLTNALKNGNIENFKIELNKILLENTSIFDVSGIYKEQFYHGLILGLILKLKNEYEISSNNFAGKGRYDLLLKPKNILERKEGIIIELKAINIDNLKLNLEKIHEKLVNECEVALNQIKEKEYTSVLKNAGIDNILKIGIAFCGKEFEVKFERE